MRPTAAALFLYKETYPTVFKCIFMLAQILLFGVRVIEFAVNPFVL
jgi:hypothetical protein